MHSLRAEAVFETLLTMRPHLVRKCDITRAQLDRLEAPIEILFAWAHPRSLNKNRQFVTCEVHKLLFTFMFGCAKCVTKY